MPNNAPFGLTKDGRPKKSRAGRPPKAKPAPISQAKSENPVNMSATAPRTDAPSAPPDLFGGEVKAPKAPSGPSFDAANPFGGEALPPPSARPRVSLAEEAGFSAPADDFSDFELNPAMRAEIAPEMDEDGNPVRKPMGEEAARAWVHMAFRIIDTAGELAIRYVFRPPAGTPDWLVEDMCLIQHLTAEDRDALREPLVRQLAKLPLTDNEMFFGTLAVIEYTRYSEGQRYFSSWAAHAEGKGPQPERPKAETKPQVDASASAGIRTDILAKLEKSDGS